MLSVRSATMSSPEHGSEQHEQRKSQAHNQGEHRHRLATACNKNIDYLTDRERQSGQRDRGEAAADEVIVAGLPEALAVMTLSGR